MSVNVYTEWDPLQEIIIGNVINTKLNFVMDFTFKLFYHENINDQLIRNNKKLQQRLIIQRQEDLDNLANILSDLGVKVKRPTMLNSPSDFITPNFKSNLHPSDNPRDLVLIVGNKIIETPVLVRHRYFETDLLKPIFMDYFKNGAHWISAPKPTLVEESFDYTYIKSNDANKRWADVKEDDDKLEIMFDAAQCMKFGRDIIMNISTKNHVLGAEWLERELGPDYKLHRVNLTDYHLDGMMMPLAPGKLLINPISMEKKLHLLPEELQKWDIIHCVDKEIATTDDETLLIASENISVNVLPINEKQCIVFSSTGSGLSSMRKSLEENGIEAIPVRLRHSRVFDGGVHCCSLDTIRKGNLETYF
ncbi:MAG: glycine amidinotransferase [Bacteriovoracaceae bacterium]|jgi:glycine amidinotransferase|nr:glycine amidinotransferase [Bacteriovoracaceae bacterium]